MKNLEEIAVIHSIDDYAAGMIIEQFFKWTGFSYYIHVYNEKNDYFNKIFIDKVNTPFDMIIFINDKEDRFKVRFSGISKMNISIEFHDGKFDIGEKLDIPEVIKFLFQVYCKYDLMQILYTTYRALKTYEDEEILLKYQAVLKNVISELKKYENSIDDSTILRGKEHLEFAMLYCCYKINDICKILGGPNEFDYWDMILKANSFHSKYYQDCYMSEHLMALFSIQSLEYKAMGISEFSECIRGCKNFLCKSNYYYEFGLLMEKAEKCLQKMFIFNNAYKTNPLNLNALFKIIVDDIERTYYDIAEKEINTFFQILQVFIIYTAEFVKKIKKIPPVELIYVSKVLNLWIQVEIRKEDIDQQYINSLKKLELLIIDIVKNGEYEILSSYFEPKYIEYVIKEVDVSLIDPNHFK